MEEWRPPSKVRAWIMRRLGCSFPETNHEAMYDNLLAVVRQRDAAVEERDELRLFEKLDAYEMALRIIANGSETGDPVELAKGVLDLWR